MLPSSPLDASGKSQFTSIQHGSVIQSWRLTECTTAYTACCRGTEKAFWRLPGVSATAVGYIGGYTENPTYQVCVWICTFAIFRGVTHSVAIPWATDCTLVTLAVRMGCSAGSVLGANGAHRGGAGGLRPREDFVCGPPPAALAIARSHPGDGPRQRPRVPVSVTFRCRMCPLSTHSMQPLRSRLGRNAVGTHLAGTALVST